MGWRRSIPSVCSRNSEKADTQNYSQRFIKSTFFKHLNISTGSGLQTEGNLRPSAKPGYDRDKYWVQQSPKTQIGPRETQVTEGRLSSSMFTFK